MQKHANLRDDRIKRLSVRLIYGALDALENEKKIDLHKSCNLILKISDEFLAAEESVAMWY
jgi:hypothetical protein